MKIKSLLVSAGVTALLLSPILGAHVVWRFFPTHDLSLLVVDYTVPTWRYSSHQGLFWLLNHLRFKAPGGKEVWQPDKDYVGYKPGAEQETHYLHETDTRNYRWIYVVDMYGVYETPPAETPTETPRPKRVFGGLTTEDVKVLDKHVQGGGNLIIEFNTLSGTSKKEIREIVEPLVGVHWTGWCGRFFSDLADKSILPEWLPGLYRQQTKRELLPEGPALMFVHETGRLVLLHGQSFTDTVPLLQVTKEGRQRFPGTYGVPAYFGWFSVVRPRRNTEVLAEIILPTKQDWGDVLMRNGIFDSIPAVTRLEAEQTLRYYLSVDLSKLHEPPEHFRLAGLPSLQAVIHRRRDAESERPAYWQFYVPLMGNILKKAAY